MSGQPVSPALLCGHPDTLYKAVEGIKAFPRMEGRMLAVTYVLNGSIDRLRVPPASSPLRSDGLWKHTCFEAFVAVKPGSTYYELNFSPSGEWAVYRFRGYRDGLPVEIKNPVPRIAVRRQAKSLELNADVCLDQLPAVSERGWLRLGLAAVIEDNEGGLSYWALRHAPGKPDFHDPNSFVLVI